MPRSFRRLIEGVDTSRRHPELSWSIKQYVCHVVDNLRIWAERLAGAAGDGDRSVGAYDQDLLARARSYENVSITGALWSLERAVRDWQDAVAIALEANVVLSHPERGDQTVLDVCRTNAHDADQGIPGEQKEGGRTALLRKRSWTRKSRCARVM